MTSSEVPSFCTMSNNALLPRANPVAAGLRTARDSETEPVPLPPPPTGGPVMESSLSLQAESPNASEVVISASLVIVCIVISRN